MLTTTVQVSNSGLPSQVAVIDDLLDDVANAWATSVSSRSISYRWAMILGFVFEMLGALLVGARTADTIKNGIIPNSAFQNNAGVQMLAFTCALAAASTWVMWCTRHSAHVSSTYSLISAVAGVGVATVGASKVQWGWNGGKGLGAIFAGLGMAPAISAGFAATIFMLIKVVVHMRRNPMPWAVWTAPFFFLVAGTICTLSIVYKGSPRLGLNKKPSWYVASVTVGTGAGVAIVSALFFVPWLHAVVIKKDYTIRWYHIFQGPLLFRRKAPADAEAHAAKVRNYAVVQEDEDDRSSTQSTKAVEEGPESSDDNEKNQVAVEAKQYTYKELVAQGEERLHAKLRLKRGPIGWAMRTLHNNPLGPGQVFEINNMKIIAKRIPAMIVVGALYGINYDIHAAQTGIAGTPDGERMKRVYAHAKKYPNETEHTYSFVQILTACTASFAHGANDIGNAVGPWAVIYSAWHTGSAAASKAPVPLWQLAVLSATISLGLVTYGYNIMKGKLSNNVDRYRANLLQLWVTKSHTTLPAEAPRWKWALPSLSFSSRSTPSRSPPPCASLVLLSVLVFAMAPTKLLTGSESDCLSWPGSSLFQLLVLSVVSSWELSSMPLTLDRLSLVVSR